MKNSNYRIVPLPTSVSVLARQRAASGTSANHAIVVAEAPTGFPCRHCLRWANPGERLVLFPFASIPAGNPYAESGPIFVHADGCERYAETQTFPPAFRRDRVLRAYNSQSEIIDAAVVAGRRSGSEHRKPAAEFQD